MHQALSHLDHHALDNGGSAPLHNTTITQALANLVHRAALRSTSQPIGLLTHLASLATPPQLATTDSSKGQSGE